MSKVFGFMDDQRKEFLKVKHEEAQRFIDPDTGKIYAHMVERVKCPVCDVDDSIPVFMKAGFEFVKCKHCGLLHVNPQLTMEVQDEIYKNSKTADHWIKLQNKGTEKGWNADKKYLPALDHLGALYPDRGKLLDVGCSTGQFLNLAKSDGWDVRGIELNVPASEIARQEYGLEVSNDKLEDCNYEPKSFDIVSLWGVLEHLTDPNKMLLEAKRFLKPGGHLLFFVPNGHSLIVRLSREHNSTVSGRAHLWYFTPATTTKLLNKNGYNKAIEYTILPQVHEIEHFLQYNPLYVEPETVCEEEFSIPDDLRAPLEKYITDNKLGYKMVTIAQLRD